MKWFAVFGELRPLVSAKCKKTLQTVVKLSAFFENLVISRFVPSETYINGILLFLVFWEGRGSYSTFKSAHCTRCFTAIIAKRFMVGSIPEEPQAAVLILPEWWRRSGLGITPRRLGALIVAQSYIAVRFKKNRKTSWESQSLPILFLLEFSFKKSKFNKNDARASKVVVNWKIVVYELARR